MTSLRQWWQSVTQHDAVAIMHEIQTLHTYIKQQINSIFTTQTTHSGQVSFFSKSASTNSSGYFAFSGQRSFNGLTFFSFARLRTVPRTIYLPDSTSSLTICIATKPEAPVTRTRDMFLVLVYENVPENLSSTVLPVHEMLGEPRKLTPTSDNRKTQTPLVANIAIMPNALL